MELLIIIGLYLFFAFLGRIIVRIATFIDYKKALKSYSNTITKASNDIKSFSTKPIDDFIKEVDASIMPSIQEVWKKSNFNYTQINSQVSEIGKDFIEDRQDGLL